MIFTTGLDGSVFMQCPCVHSEAHPVSIYSYFIEAPCSPAEMGSPPHCIGGQVRYAPTSWLRGMLSLLQFITIGFDKKSCKAGKGYLFKKESQFRSN
jgi:hypothetical protein